jgi:hypothetical protein
MTQTELTDLIEQYAKRCVDDMDMDELCVFAQTTVEESLTGCAEDYIIETIREYYPELIE